MNIDQTILRIDRETGWMGIVISTDHLKIFAVGLYWQVSTTVIGR